MSVLNLEKIFAPRSIAVIGASEKSGSVGTMVTNNLVNGGYKGRLYPVNPKYTHVSGQPAFKSVGDLPAAPDLVMIATPIETVAELVRQCMEKGAGGAMVLSAGGRETGKKGAAIEEEIKSQIQSSGFRLLGPNCLGIISTRHCMNATFANRMAQRGKMAFISQSGAICTAILDFAEKSRVGFSYFVSLGSMLDVDFGDVIDYLGNEPQVSSIVMYVESLTRIRNFMSAARSVSRVKPIIALKAGRTRAGAAAAASHTGALAGEDAVYDAAFKRAGIVRVKTFAELFDCAEFIGKQPKPSGHGLAILTNAGGPGVMAADALWDYGFSPVTLEPETIRQLDAILPPHWSHANPVDILGDATAERYASAAEILAGAREVNGLLIMLAPQAIAEPTRVAEVLAEQLKKQSYPVFTAWLGGSDVEDGRAVFHKAGIPTFDSPERAVRAFMDLCRYSRNIEMLQQIPEKLPHRLDFDRQKAKALIDTALARETGHMPEIEAKDLLAAYGIPVNPTMFAGTAEQAAKLAEKTGFPVVLKVASSRIVHKSDVGGVALNLCDSAAVSEAFGQMARRIEDRCPGAFDGVSVQKMLPQGSYELIAGARKDREFGPVVLFGTGGVLTEVFKDRSIALPPLNRLLARKMMEETRIYKVLQGYRNLDALDLVQFEALLIRLSQLMTDFAEISEIDINPLMVHDGRIIAVDARVIVSPAEVKAPLHLVISPYPNEYEEQLDLEDVGVLTVRPIRPEDAPLLEEMFNELSPMSIYYRFFSPIKRLPHYMLARFTQIDYDRQIAMVAISTAGGIEKMLGVSRVIGEPDGKTAEFAVLVADQWHGKGIGAILLKRCLEIARSRNTEKIWGLILPDNTKMLALARKLGFDIRKDNTGEYEATLRFQNSGGEPDKPSYAGSAR
ncbi:MAG: bifunctional acetate--CoA ligase family protein/GNAT family N-acetyltransferase [Desulfobacteraceae bacterium]|nr:bifunctional acetate--CoA ligase family protein/GNAT family N-acetyltransferase [Desulfobacteraceae bacterium]